MTDTLRLIGGPLDNTMIGPWERYPDRIIFEYDCVRHPANIALVPVSVNTAGAETLVAQYDMDEGWAAYTFAGWTIKRVPIIPPSR